jgi:hypothetical protein
VNHLKRVNVPGLEIDDSLDNWWDATWLSYLEVESPGFMLVSPMWRTTGTISILLRTLILQLFSQRVSLAFLAELKFSDNRIYTFCWEPYDRRAEIELFKAVGSKLPAFVAALPAPKSRADAQKGVTAAFNSQSRDWRYALTVEACKHMLASSKDAVLVDLAKVTVVHSVLLKHLSLQERAWRLPEAAQSATSALSSTVHSLRSSLSAWKPPRTLSKKTNPAVSHSLICSTGEFSLSFFTVCSHRSHRTLLR